LGDGVGWGVAFGTCRACDFVRVFVCSLRCAAWAPEMGIASNTAIAVSDSSQRVRLDPALAVT